MLVGVLLTLTACNDKPEANDETTRTVLVYMVAANSLGTPVHGYPAADSVDLREMATAASRKKLGSGRWLVFYATYDSSQLLELTRNGYKVLKTYENTPATDADRMAQVVADAKALAPAQSYGMVLWSHANGWLEDGVSESIDPLGGSGITTQSFGVHGTKKMNITTMACVLEDCGMDYLYFDCCLMGSVEVMYELRHCAPYILSSPSELPRDGMNYEVNLPLLIDGSRQALIESARNTFEHYNSMPDADDRSATMTVVETAGLDELARATRAIYCLTEPAHPLKQVTNYFGSNGVSQGNYLDFGEYVRAIAERDGIDQTLVDAYNKALDSAVIYHKATDALWTNWLMLNPTGLSTRVFSREKDLDGLHGYSRLQWTSDVVVPRFTLTDNR